MTLLTVGMVIGLSLIAAGLGLLAAYIRVKKYALIYHELLRREK